ncbi:MAG: hypothetical protein WDW36_007203, partial [Sanguina aurantia]
DLPRGRRCCACLDRPFPSTQASRVEPLPPNFPALIRAESGGGVSLVWHDGDGGRTEQDAHHRTRPHPKARGGGGDSGRAETAAQLTHAPRSSLSPRLPDGGMRSGQPVTKDGVRRLPPAGPGGTSGKTTWRMAVTVDRGRRDHAAGMASRVEPLPPNFPALIRAESGGGVSLVWHDGDGGRTEQDAHHRTRPHPKARGGGGDSGRAETAAQLTHAPRSSLSPRLPDGGMRSGQPVTKDGVRRLPPCGAGRHVGKDNDLPRGRRCCACLDRPFPSTQASRVEPLPPNFPALIRAESGGGVSLVWHDGDGGRTEQDAHHRTRPHPKARGGGGDSGRAETAAQLTHAPRSSLSPRLPDGGMRSGQPVTKDGVRRLPPCGAGRHVGKDNASRVEPLPPNFPALIRAESGGGVSLVWHDGDAAGRGHAVGPAGDQRWRAATPAPGPGGTSGKTTWRMAVTVDRGRQDHAAGMRRCCACLDRPFPSTQASRVEPLPPNFPALIRAESGGGVSWFGMTGTVGAAGRGMRSGQPVTKDGVRRLPPAGPGGTSGKTTAPSPQTYLPRGRRCCACLDRPFPSTQASRVEPLPPNFPALIRAESGGGVSRSVWHDGDGGRMPDVGHAVGPAGDQRWRAATPALRGGRHVTKTTWRMAVAHRGRQGPRSRDGSRAIKPSCPSSPVPPEPTYPLERRRCVPGLDRPFPSTQASRVEPLPPNFPALIRAESGGGVSRGLA